MRKIILQSQEATVLIGGSPAWKTTQDSGKLFSLVQNSQFSINLERIQNKFLGQKNNTIDHIYKSPEVDLSIDYYLNPYLNNELLMGFSGENSFIQAFRNIHEKNYNFYLLVNSKDKNEIFQETKKTQAQRIGFSGYDLISIGNAYLTNYSLNFSLGSIPTVSTSFKCSNCRIDNLTGNRYVQLPAINLRSGNNVGVGTIDLSGIYDTMLSGYISGDPKSRTEYNPLVTTPKHSKIFLNKLSVGGAPMQTNSLPILQSVDINIEIPRNDLYGLGSNYVFDRKIQYPINAQIQLSALVSGFESGFITGLVNTDVPYNVGISFTNDDRHITGYFEFQQARLNNYGYSMQVNGIMNFQASFSCSITDEKGFKMYRASGSSAQQTWGTPNFGRTYTS